MQCRDCALKYIRPTGSEGTLLEGGVDMLSPSIGGDNSAAATTTTAAAQPPLLGPDSNSISGEGGAQRPTVLEAAAGGLGGGRHGRGRGLLLPLDADQPGGRTLFPANEIGIVYSEGDEHLTGMPVQCGCARTSPKVLTRPSPESPKS